MLDPVETSALTEDSEPSSRKPVSTSGIDFMSSIRDCSGSDRETSSPQDLNGTNLHE
ncbi:hypothetical protein HispidOSU_017488, partial [Sigmodon hispidus]